MWAWALPTAPRGLRAVSGTQACRMARSGVCGKLGIGPAVAAGVDRTVAQCVPCGRTLSSREHIATCVVS